MNRIAHILCPVDFSEISQHALDHAAGIAGWSKARLTVLYVFASRPTMDVPPLVLEASERTRLMNAMKDMAARIPAGVPLDFKIEEAGYIHEEIVAQIGATHADLLVLGTHGRSGFQHLFLGSVTEKVIRKATCPTLVVPPRAGDVPPNVPVQFDQILCAVDFSESSLDAVEYAVEIAGESGSRLTLLHVVDIPTLRSEEPGVVAVDLGRIRQAAVEDARRRLRDLVPDHARANGIVEPAVVEGRAHPEILRHAADGQSDLIVMGARGRGAVDRLLFGSTTHHVIRAARCPVLIVRRS